MKVGSSTLKKERKKETSAHNNKKIFRFGGFLVSAAEL